MSHYTISFFDLTKDHIATAFRLYLEPLHWMSGALARLRDSAGARTPELKGLSTSRAWRVIFALQVALLITGSFLILNVLTTSSVLKTMAWVVAVISLLGVLVAFIYEKSLVVEHATAGSAQVDGLKTVSRETERQEFVVTRDLVTSAAESGLVKLYRERAKANDELKQMLSRAKREVKFLGVSIDIVGRMPYFEEVVRERTKAGVSFQFAFLAVGARDLDFFHQRAREEHYPMLLGDLKAVASANMARLGALRDHLDDESKSRLEIRKYKSFPYMSVAIIDDEMFVQPYMFGETSAVAPMFRFARKDRGIYDAYYRQFEVLWSASVDFGNGENDW